MAITEEQRQARIGRIGGSDIGAILGLNPHRSAADVVLECSGRVEPSEGNKATRRGNYLEPALLMFAEEELGAIAFPDTIVHPSGVLAVNLDAVVVNTGAVVEAKSSVLRDEWGEPYTDQIPPHYAAQGMFAMALAGADVAWFPVVLPGYRDFDFRMYRLDFNREMGGRIVEEALRFHEKHVRLGIPADDFRPSIEVLKRLKRVPNKTAEIPDEVMDRWIASRSIRIQAEDDEAVAKEDLIASLKDAEAGKSSGATVTYYETHCKARVVKEYKFRSLKLLKEKAND